MKFQRIVTSFTESSLAGPIPKIPPKWISQVGPLYLLQVKLPTNLPDASIGQKCVFTDVYIPYLYTNICAHVLKVKLRVFTT